MSLSLFTLDHFLIDYLRIFPLTLRSEIANTDKPFKYLKRHFAGLPRQFGLILVDSITLIVAHSNPVSIIDFFSACKDLYDMEFFNVSIKGSKRVASFNDLFWDQLIEVFERQTGLYLRL